MLQDEGVGSAEGQKVLTQKWKLRLRSGKVRIPSKTRTRPETRLEHSSNLAKAAAAVLVQVQIPARWDFARRLLDPL